MRLIDEAYLQQGLRTFDPAIMTPAVLESLSSPFNFVPAATRDGRDFSPGNALVRLVDHYLQLHASPLSGPMSLARVHLGQTSHVTAPTMPAFSLSEFRELPDEI